MFALTTTELLDKILSYPHVLGIRISEDHERTYAPVVCTVRLSGISEPGFYCVGTTRQWCAQKALGAIMYEPRFQTKPYCGEGDDHGTA